MNFLAEKILGWKHANKYVILFLVCIIFSGTCLTVFHSISLRSSIEINNKNHAIINQLLVVFKKLRGAKTSIENQVHDWKNILIRGVNDHDDYEKYLSWFMSNERNVQLYLSDAVLILENMGTHEKILYNLKDAIVEHLTIGNKYRAALKLLDPMNAQSSAIVDSTVRGIDRDIVEKIDKLLEKSILDISDIQEADYQQEILQYQSHTLEIIFYTVLIVVFISVIVFFMVLNRKTHREIIRRRDAEALLHKKEELIRSILDNTPSVIFIKDMQGRYSFVNRQFEDMFHVKNDSLSGKTDYDIFTADVASRFQENDQVALSSGTHILADETIQQGDGEHFYISVKFPLLDESGQPYAVCGISTDITERKKMEESLARSEAYFRTLFEFSRDAVMLFDGHRFFDCNTATLTLFGCANREDFYRLHPADLSPPMQPQGENSRILAKQHIDVALAQGFSRFDWMHRRANGDEFPAEVLLSAVVLNEQEVILAVVRDITERKQAEEILRQAKVQAEETSQEKTAFLDIMQQHMQQLRRLGAHMDQVSETEKKRLSDEFHEAFANNLAAAKLSLAILAKRQRDEADQQRCQEIYQLTDSALRSARRISLSLRPDALDRVGLRAGLEELVGSMKGHVGLKCRMKANGEDWPLDESHRTALFRIAQEALTNVIRHAEAKEVVVNLRQETEAVVLEISDNGRGIAAERARNVDSLGLVCMKERAERLGGTLEVVAMETGGTRVTARIPMKTKIKG
ncbi:MAG: PAS domain S-box protein [Magnetococcus sp. YQC-5]